MKHKTKRWFCMLLCMGILLSSVVVIGAREPQETEASAAADILLSTPEELLRFAQQCRLDTYSEGLTVRMTDNIDMTGAAFEPIPFFCGTFDGDGYAITGLTITGNGSVQGLFRYLTDTAVVHDLTLRGEIRPGGSRCVIGGIAGSNAGKIRDCTVSLTLSGSDRVGGIAGINTVSGIIEGCRAAGDIHGNHDVGGIAGENDGVIRDCINEAGINAAEQQNRIDISDVTLDTLMGSESANAVTDIGGIAGISSGVIRSCTNQGTVGYKHMGYNIGGIAGSQRGYLLECENYGAVSGRKEVGGIVGQAEPTTRIVYQRDTLQMLQSQMSGLSALTNRMSGRVSSGREAMADQFAAMGKEAERAGEALSQLLPKDRESLRLPDEDTILAAQNVLGGSISALNGSMESMAAAAQDTAGDMIGDVKAIVNQVSAIGSTINNASKYLGAHFTDVSDSDTQEDTSGEVSGCVNLGDVLADLNAGGIVGAAALENDLNPEDDIQITGSSSLNLSGELRIVIVNCENKAQVTVKKRNAGGIVGWLSLGLVKDCQNVGAVQAQGADYVGGVAGRSTGYIRSCNAKCELLGSTCVGGIAGSAAIVSDCRSMVDISSASEKSGAILGEAEQGYASAEHPIQNNFYLSPGEDFGGIDGISYAQSAASLDRTEFLALDGLHDIFRTVTVSFLYDDGTQQIVTVPLGGRLDTAQIPALPNKDGIEGTWEGLEELSASELSFDATLRAVYANRYTTIQSEAVRKNGRPVLLGQGEFPSKQWITLTECINPPALLPEQTLVEGWEMTLPSEGTLEALRYAVPAEYTDKTLQLMVYGKSNTWREVEFTVDGSHLVFVPEEDDTAFCLLYTQPNYIALVLSACAVIILLQFLLLVTMRIKLHRQKKHSRKPVEAAVTPRVEDDT